MNTSGKTMNSQLETPKQLAKRVGLTEKAVRKLLKGGKLSFVRIGTRLRIPPGTWEVYLKTNVVQPWRDEISDQNFSSSANASASISSGQRVDAAASAALAQQTAQRLKLSSRSSSKDTQGGQAQETHRKS
jgi:excisionase family DNA binding protein